MPASRWGLVLTALVTATLVSTLPATPARGDELKSKMSRKLSDIGFKRLLDDLGETAVAVGDFTTKAQLNSSGGLAIGRTLIDALQDMGVRVDRRARHEVSGKISRGQVKGLSALKVHAEVEDTKAERVVLEFEVELVDAATIMRVAGGTGDISGNRRDEQSGKVERNLDNPTVQISSRPGSPVPDSRVAASASSPYAIELLVKQGENDYRPRSAAVVDGQAVVPLTRDDVYAVRLINDSDQNAAVILALDGLSMFSFSDTPADREARVILSPHSDAVITGWYRNDGPKGSNEFLITRLSEAAVAQLLPPSPARVGMVTAEFAVAWPRGTPTPPGEVDDLTKDDGLGTAIGKPIDQPFQRVDFLYGKPKSVVTIRYDKPGGRN